MQRNSKEDIEQNEKKKAERVKTRVEISDLVNEKTGIPHLQNLLKDFLLHQNEDYLQNVSQLLEIYKTWGKNVRPGISFEQFVAQLYKLGKNEIMCDWLRNEENKGRTEEEEFQPYQYMENQTEDIEQYFNSTNEDNQSIEEGEEYF
ncbi:hypothetical protein EHI8A_069060 [Entamoeba histolytica HM-1:IMSS-B]|uniref:Chromosome segregation in meiosis protein 3 domain-containing protein n=6 Tax=Entamoeba histolytica TaxID=5759 RepID=C4LYK6_ENTH1|nr:hypothetical protein EHI_118450 [Entamoeba histolytica HM-1:IMSS]EMD44672.1 Hypothetical protein EHI5A_030490 [Entamoeba histolytica KU27]EMH77422.1 hypothetical protein EHI8A_069060 [Entamoeba histolytica HM-1:IMSS-B]EMS13216.1 hypothetical protein KM1_034850 [Entamoeba histolytica HM-3:IMSS]ENY61575.1 hypothetical protein EHI7A_069090 [Entamoeba histolytica HM-1:IMSS-A]GAT93910.1 hypothetical protein CL6EHI_118450 [Entamoeba histolytica]|eukprot:XP_649906.1 hypothetical protein EHI_118450 [Entamoeba histolytica HM-1:IMSS]